MQDPVRIGLYYDFASVVCFAAHRVMAQVEEELSRLAIEIRWLAVDLTVMTGWQRGDPVRGRRTVSARATVAQLLEERIEFPRIWTDSRWASGVALTLEGSGEAGNLAEQWRRRVFDSVFKGGRSLDEPELVSELAAELRFEPCSRDVAAGLVEEATRAAIELGVVGVPSFLLGQYPVGGIQDPETMVTFLSRYADRARNDPEPVS